MLGVALIDLHARIGALCEVKIRRNECPVRVVPLGKGDFRIEADNAPARSLVALLVGNLIPEVVTDFLYGPNILTDDKTSVVCAFQIVIYDEVTRG